MYEQEGETSTMPVTVTPELRRLAKREIVRMTLQGASASEARVQSLVPMHRVTVYRLLKRVQSEGEKAFADERHGHAYRLCGETATFVRERCQAQSSISSSSLQCEILEKFGSAPSVSQLNRFRARQGLTRQTGVAQKKTSNDSAD